MYSATCRCVGGQESVTKHTHPTHLHHTHCHTLCHILCLTDPGLRTSHNGPKDSTDSSGSHAVQPTQLRPPTARPGGGVPPWSICTCGTGEACEAPTPCQPPLITHASVLYVDVLVTHVPRVCISHCNANRSRLPSHAHAMLCYMCWAAWRVRDVCWVYVRRLAGGQRQDTDFHHSHSFGRLCRRHTQWPGNP